MTTRGGSGRSHLHSGRSRKMPSQTIYLDGVRQVVVCFREAAALPGDVAHETELGKRYKCGKGVPVTYCPLRWERRLAMPTHH